MIVDDLYLWVRIPHRGEKLPLPGTVFLWPIPFELAEVIFMMHMTDVEVHCFFLEYPPFNIVAWATVEEIADPLGHSDSLPLFQLRMQTVMKRSIWLSWTTCQQAMQCPIDGEFGSQLIKELIQLQI